MLFERLNTKIEELLHTMQNQKEEIQDLRLKNATLKAQSEEKDHQISQLYEQLAQKDAEIEKIIERIETTLK